MFVCRCDRICVSDRLLFLVCSSCLFVLQRWESPALPALRAVIEPSGKAEFNIAA